ncbi:Methylaspartate ammonia-lyase [Salmonella enterica subsp. diarizonae]|uniref:Methylaspartate ammonia-lyase n=1 Tax=Salmonella diarizonae TaxID=59204 RepID=A0A379U1P4_SALDZ|nr:Methylaspartate ammonia-lyase [Salmonella enterica subsp. diarizonae]
MMDSFYTGAPVTPGFTSVRQAGECVSVQLILENGAVAVGDCAAVQYSGAGGRDPLFLADHFIPFLNTHIKPLLEGRDVDTFCRTPASSTSCALTATCCIPPFAMAFLRRCSTLPRWRQAA